MSSSGDQPRLNRREVAYRVFAVEFNDATVTYSASEEERAPNYVLFPSGVRANRVFVVGVLTAVETVGDNVIRARIADPTGVFVVYAGQYQPESQTALEQADVPSFVAVTGKPRTFTPDDVETVYTSIRPESITVVDAETRDRWVVQTSQHTLDRVDTVQRALGNDDRGDELREALQSEGVEPGLAAGIPLVLERYEITTEYLEGLREQAIQATEVIADQREDVESLDTELSVSGTDREPRMEADPISTTDESREEVSTEPEEGPESVESAIDDDEAAGETSEPAGEAIEGTVDTDELYEFDEGEREAIEDEYGTDFSTGNEIEQPAGEIDHGETEGAEEPETETEPTGESDEVDAVEAEEDIVEIVMTVMRDLDDSAGSTNIDIIETVREKYEIDEDSIEDAIEDALMEGRCYEPEEGKLKPI